MSRFAQQRVWIVGGASGIGRATALAFAREEAVVVVSDRDESGLAALAAESPGGAGLETAPLDIARAEDVRRVADGILERHGRVDVLVNCAGINLRDRHFDTLTTEGWDEIVGVNLSGMFYCCQAVLPQMRERGRGTIVNVASWAARYAAYFPGPAYNASKRAVVALTESINIEACRDGVRATSILPEEVNTPLVDKRPTPPPTADERARMLQADDVASAVVFVAGLPPHACVNELLISPTWNRFYLGGLEPPK